MWDLGTIIVRNQAAALRGGDEVQDRQTGAIGTIVSLRGDFAVVHWMRDGSRTTVRRTTVRSLRED